MNEGGGVLFAESVLFSAEVATAIVILISSSLVGSFWGVESEEAERPCRTRTFLAYGDTIDWRWWQWVGMHRIFHEC